MQRHIAAYGVGTIIAIALGSWMGCDNGLGPGTVPEPDQEGPPASPRVDAPPPTVARVTETAAQNPPLPPWHDCLSDVGGVWQVDDGRRCVAVQALHTVTGWSRRCAHNRAYFPDPDWRCCVDDGSGRCVPGSEASYGNPPGETELEVAPPQQPPEFEDWRGPKVWIHGTSPAKDLELCEGDYIHVVALRRANSEGELRGSVYLMDPERESVMLEDSGIEGSFRFAEGEDRITTFALEDQRIGRCPGCGEKREVFLGIDGRLLSGDGDPVEGHRLGPEFRYQVRKATDELCQPE